MKTNDLKNTRAITLIALIVSIIVLLILAGVSIAVLTGENGILNRATEAKQTNEQKTAEEELKLGVSALSIDYRKNATNPQTFKQFVTSNNGADLKTAMGLETTNQDLKVENAENGIVSYKGQKYKIDDYGGVAEYVPPTEEELAIAKNGIEVITSSNNDLNDKSKIRMVLTGDVPIPVNATYITGTKSTGIVIEYKESQFVWIPVAVAISDTEANGTINKAMALNVGTEQNPDYRGLLYDFSGLGNDVISTIQSGCTTITSNYREPDIVTGYDSISYEYLKDIGFVKNNQSDPDGFLSTLKADYKEMVESVAKYGGFFVGKYETSIDSTTGVASKPTVMPMTAETSSGNMWYGMYDKQRKFSTAGLQSSMIWGSQWDAMLNWMLTGNEKAKVTATGNGNHSTSSDSAVGCGTYNSGSDVINNIYDLEGNLYEWTLEAHNFYSYKQDYDRTVRGGLYDESLTPSRRRQAYSPNSTSSSAGSRMSLYIK